MCGVFLCYLLHCCVLDLEFDEKRKNVETVFLVPHTVPMSVCCLFSKQTTQRLFLSSIPTQQQVHHIHTERERTKTRTMIIMMLIHQRKNRPVAVRLLQLLPILSSYNDGCHVLTGFIRGVDVSNRSRGRCNVTKRIEVP